MAATRRKTKRTPARKASTRTEREIAAPAVKWLLQDGWCVLEELTIAIPEGLTASPKIWKPDIVATKVFEAGVIVIVWEVKRSLNTQVIAQAKRWRTHAHRVSVVVPHPGRCTSREHNLLLEMARSNGVGVIYITAGDEVRFQSSDPKAPSRKAAHNPSPSIAPIMLAVRAARDAEERRVAAGAPSEHQPAGSPSPLGETGLDERSRWHKVRQYVAKNPGATSKEIKLEFGLKKSDTNDLIRLARAEKLEGIKVREFVGQLLFYPKETRHA